MTYAELMYAECSLSGTLPAGWMDLALQCKVVPFDEVLEGRLIAASLGADVDDETAIRLRRRFPYRDPKSLGSDPIRSPMRVEIAARWIGTGITVTDVLSLTRDELYDKYRDARRRHPDWRQAMAGTSPHYR